MRREAGSPADMHVVLFTALCVLSAVCGGLLALFVDVILVGAYGTAGNFATPVIFLINRGLRRLRQEGCDKEAIFNVGEALQKDGNARIASNIYLGFAAVCGNGEGEKYAAANILYQLADYDPVIMIMTEMIAAKPATADYRYLRGAALVGAKREAV